MATEGALQTLVGRTLASVEFVQDYMQLRFDGPTLNVYGSLSVHRAGRRYEKGDVGYADALVACVGAKVEGIEQDMVHMDIVVGESLIAISLDPSHDESALLSGVGDAEWSF